MANVIGQIMEDIGFRINDGKMNDFPPAVILRAMIRLYQRLNEEYMVVVRDITVNDTNYPTFSTNGYITLPDDFIRVCKIDELLNYVPWEAYDEDEYNTYSIYNNRLYIANADEDTEHVVSYYSSGYTLVDAEDADVATGEVNEPEYPDHLQQILLYGTAIDLSSKYPKFESDIRMFMKLEQAIQSHATFKQAFIPETAGPKERNTTVDSSDPYA